MDPGKVTAVDTQTAVFWPRSSSAAAYSRLEYCSVWRIVLVNSNTMVFIDRGAHTAVFPDRGLPTAEFTQRFSPNAVFTPRSSYRGLYTAVPVYSGLYRPVYCDVQRPKQMPPEN